MVNKQAIEGIIDRNAVNIADDIFKQYESGQRSYEDVIRQLLNLYAQALEGVDYDVVLNSTREFYKASEKFFPYVKPLIERLKPTHDIAIVTGEAQIVASVVAEIFDVPNYFCSQYELINQKFTGKVTKYLSTKEEKQAAIAQFMAAHSRKNSLAIGDSESDIGILESVDKPICINPTPGLKEIAEQKGWQISSPTELLDD